MNTFIAGERWVPIVFPFHHTNNNRVEVSNFGRIRTFNKLSDGNILHGSMINGYRIIRLKFFKPRSPETDAKFTFLQAQVLKLAADIKRMRLQNKLLTEIDESIQLLETMKKRLKQKYADETRLRTIHYHALVHRLVADYFLPGPTPNQTVVAHLDHDKLNNNVANLRWMTPEENYAHQQKSPNVIAERIDRKTNPLKTPPHAKLTVTRVMLLKKMLNEGKPIKTLIKQFKVTETQIFRIKRGENWSNIPAAT